jgi:hypothetical protein
MQGDVALSKISPGTIFKGKLSESPTRPCTPTPVSRKPAGQRIEPVLTSPTWNGLLDSPLACVTWPDRPKAGWPQASWALDGSHNLEGNRAQGKRPAVLRDLLTFASEMGRSRRLSGARRHRTIIFPKADYASTCTHVGLAGYMFRKRRLGGAMSAVCGKGLFSS